jgi:hypothetical protein
MFDLEQSLRQWRQEIEATLAFSSDEIDELEDHLRFSVDAKLKEGLTPENAWTRSLGGLGSASALALEFAKEKLMPALWRLLIAWWRPALLLFLFGLTFVFCVQLGWQQSTPGYNFDPWVARQLLSKGEKDVTIAFLGNISKFWAGHEQQIQGWQTAIQQGQTTF